MALGNVQVSVSQPNVNVSATGPTITVSPDKTNVTVTSSNNVANVSLTTTTSNITVDTAVPRDVIRNSISFTNVYGYGGLDYEQSNGVITYTLNAGNGISIGSNGAVDDGTISSNFDDALFAQSIKSGSEDQTSIVAVAPTLTVADRLAGPTYQDANAFIITDAQGNIRVPGNVTGNVDALTVTVQHTGAGVPTDSVTSITEANVSRTYGEGVRLLVNDSNVGLVNSNITFIGGFIGGAQYFDGSIQTAAGPDIYANVLEAATANIGGKIEINDGTIRHNSGNIGLNTDSGSNVIIGPIAGGNARVQGSAPVGNLHVDNSVIATYFHGDGSNISGLPSGLTNAQVQTFIQDNGLNGSGNIATTGVVTFGNSVTQTHNFTGNINVTGNIEVDGNLNYRNVEDLYVQDQSITLNANAATDATSSIIINRPVAGANTVLRWNETDDKWQFSNDGSTYQNLIGLTDFSVTTNSPSGNGSLAYSNTTGVFTFTPADTSGHLTNAQAQAYIEADGLDMTGNMTFTGATITTDALISTSDNLEFTATTPVIEMTEQGKIRRGNISNSNSPILSFLPGNMGTYTLTDNETDAFGEKFNIGYEMYQNHDSGIMNMYAKGRGNISAPAGPSNGDRVFDEYFMHYNSTKFTDRSNFGQAGRFVFYDEGVATFDDSTMPLTQEFFAFGGGDLSGGVPKSLLRLSANGTISFNGDATREDFTSANANIELDGSINSSATITGTTLTDGTLTATGGNITGAGSITSTTFTDGSFSVTGGAFTTVTSIGALGNIDTNGNIVSFGGGLVGTLHGDGSNVTNVAAASATTSEQTDAVVKTCIATETINKGQAVAITGGTGDNPNVSLALASNASLMPAFGIALENISATNTGNIAIYGVISGVDTSTFTVGDELFISTSSAGDFQATAPTGETNFIQKVGKVVRSNASGIISVQGAGRTNATPNLDENKIFIGNATNQATTVALDNLTANIKTTGNLQVNPDTAVAGLKGLTYDSSTNRLGLGTTSPTAGLEIVSSADTDAQIYLTEYDDGPSSADIRFRRAEGTEASPTTMNDGDHVGQLFFTPWRQNADSTGNASHATTFGGDWGIGMEIATFAEGDQNLVYSMPVATLEDQGAGSADRLQFTDTSIRYNDGIVIAIDNTTNANLTVLNGNAFYADNVRIGGQNYYDLYYDEARTLPVEVAVGTETATDMTGNIVAVVNPVGLEIIAQEQQNDRFSIRNIHKIRSNGDIEIGSTGTDTAGTPSATINTDGVFTTTGNITTTANISAGNVLGIVKGEVDTTSNITTTANVSGNYILGNGSQLSGLVSDSFNQILVSGESNIDASGATALTVTSTGDITLATDAANNTLTIGGSGGAYGNSNVTNYLASGTSVGDIDYTGNLFVQASNTSLAVSNYDGNVSTGGQDQITFASDPALYEGEPILFSGTTNANLTSLNGSVFYVKAVGGGAYNLFTDEGTINQYQSGLGTESPSGLTADFRNEDNRNAYIYGNAYVSGGRDGIGGLHTDVIKPFTSGGTIGFSGVRMSDVGLGGSSGDDFFWPETGRPDEGSLLIAGENGSGYWAQGLVLENDSLDTPVLSNVSSSRSTIPGGIQNIYRRSRGDTASPTAIQLNSGSNPDIISSTKFLGHDGTNYQPSFFSNVYVDGAVSTGVVPLAMEISTWENGNSSTTNSGFGFPIVKFKSDRSIEFNSPNPLNYNNPQGNANITADGSFNTNASIVAVGDITGTTVNATNISVTGTSISTANNTVFTIGTDPDHKLEIQAEHARLQFEADVDSPHLVVYTYRNGTVGGTREYYRSSGSAASPTAIGNNDIVLNEEYFGHDGTSFGTAGRPNANFQVFQDDTVGTSANVVPLSMEWTVNPEGHAGSTFGQSCIKIASDRTLHLQDVNTRGFTGAYDGNVKIVEDGSITTKANVTVGDRLQLKSYSNTEILALTTPSAGEMVYNSTDNRVAYYNGTNWQNLDAGTTIT